MPGLYLAAIAFALLGVLALDVRFRLMLAIAPAQTMIAVAIGTVFFLVWDLVGIAAGVFVKGGSPLLLGIDLAPHLPLEEPVFLAFLCYLALVSWAGARRLTERHGRAPAERRES